MWGAAFSYCKTGDLTWSAQKSLKVLQAANPRFTANRGFCVPGTKAQMQLKLKSIIDLHPFTDTSAFM